MTGPCTLSGFSSEPVSDTYDALVVGAGAGGLCTAARLACAETAELVVGRIFAHRPAVSPVRPTGPGPVTGTGG